MEVSSHGNQTATITSENANDHTSYFLEDRISKWIFIYNLVNKNQIYLEQFVHWELFKLSTHCHKVLLTWSSINTVHLLKLMFSTVYISFRRVYWQSVLSRVSAHWINRKNIVLSGKYFRRFNGNHNSNWSCYFRISTQNKWRKCIFKTSWPIYEIHMKNHWPRSRELSTLVNRILRRLDAW